MELAFECELRWDDLEGDSDTRRKCGQCDHFVYNISNMTRAHAEHVIELHRERQICVHFVKRDGRIVHKGDPLEQLRIQRQGIRRLLAVALIGHAGFLAFSDDPAASFFDPFAAVAQSLQEARDEAQTFRQKYDEAKGEVRMGGMMF